MKLYHAIIAIIIVSVLVFTFVGWGDGGLLTNMKYLPNGSASYNDDINLSAFSGYDVREDTGKIEEGLKNATDSSSVSSGQETEQNLIERMLQAFREFGTGFTASYQMINTFIDRTLLPNWVFWAASSIIAIFFILKLGGSWFFNR